MDDTFFAVPLPRGAGTVTSLSRADGIISVARDCEGISRDEPVQVQLLRPRQQVEGTLLAIGRHAPTLDKIEGLLSNLRITSASSIK